jgi:HPt (histidine-containing phosphotransfer) domain-containing protein
MDALSQDALERLNKLGGPAFLCKMIDLFLNFGAGKVKEARAAFGRNDFDGLGKAAHSLKSSAANVGALCVEQIATTIEQQVRSGKIDTLGDAVDKLEFEFEKVRPLLSARKPSAAPDSRDSE